MTTDSPSNTDTPAELVLRGATVSSDERGNVCLNDLWKLAGKPENRKAGDWYPSKRAKALDEALRRRMGEIFPHSPKISKDSTYYTQGRGVKARTYAHPVLALDYSEYLAPDLAVEVRETFL